MKAYRIQVGLAVEGGLLPIGGEVVVEPGEEQFTKAWRQRGFQRRRIVMIDPKVKPAGDLKDLVPNEDILLIFTEKPSKEWTSWMKKHKVEYEDKGILSKTKLTGLLETGNSMLGGFRLTHEAAEFVVEYFGEDSLNRFFATCFTLEHTRQPHQTLLGMDELAELWPDTGVKNARDISHFLGTRLALETFRKVSRDDSESVFGLFRYLEIILPKKRPEWVHALNLCRAAADRLRFSHWDALFHFMVYCYKEATWLSKSSKKGATASSSLRKSSTPFKDLCRRCATPC